MARPIILLLALTSLLISTMASSFLPQAVTRLMGILEKTRLILPSQVPTLTIPRILIGTHDGSFHCDEALAIGLLHLNPAFDHNNLVVVRTRDPKVLETCDVVVDVGAVYNPSQHRYDHHQREFTGVLEPFSMKLSSAGLIYKHFGRDIVKSLIQSFLHCGHEEGSHSLMDDIKVDDKLVTLVYEKAYKDFMEHIDGIDNGVSIAPAPHPPAYHISTSLSARVGYLNPPWTAPASPVLSNEQFCKAMYLTTSEFLQCINNIVTVFLPARTIVASALGVGAGKLENGQEWTAIAENKVIVLDHYCPWTEHLFDLEKELNIESRVLYVLYADQGGSWRVQAVPVSPHSFQSRRGLPMAWRGVRDEKLSELAGIDGCIFVHAGGFIGGAKTKEGALALALKALEME